MSTEYNTEDQLIKGVINHGVDILEFSLANIDLKKYSDRVVEEKLNYWIPRSKIDIEWFMPKEYAEIDIEKFLDE